MWRAVPAPPCCPTYYFDRTPLPASPAFFLFHLSPRPSFSRSSPAPRPPLPLSTIFADIDEPPCALLSSTWTLPDESRLDVLGREIDRLFRVFPVSLFLPFSRFSTFFFFMRYDQPKFSRDVIRVISIYTVKNDFFSCIFLSFFFLRTNARFF